MKSLVTAALAASMASTLSLPAIAQSYSPAYGQDPQTSARGGGGEPSGYMQGDMHGGSQQFGVDQRGGVQNGAMQYGYGQDFWRGSPTGSHDRLAWLHERLERGMRDGSVTSAEGARIRRMLQQTSRVEARLTRRDQGTLTSRDAEYMQRRLDNMSRQIRWARTNGVGDSAPS